MEVTKLLARITELQQAQDGRRAAAARGEITRLRELADLADLEEAIARDWEDVRAQRASGVADG